MPSTSITTRQGWIKDPQAVLNAIHAAQVETIGVSPQAQRARLIELPASHFLLSEKNGERFIEVQIILLPGRTPEAKAAFYAALKRNLGQFDVPEGDVKAILLEIPKSDWS